MAEGHGLDDAVLESLALPSHLMAAGDANGDGALSNIEFYEAMDPLKEDGSTCVVPKNTPL
jgi:hypothetical protein